MKKLRKKYFTIIGIAVILFTSCNPEQIDLNNDNELKSKLSSSVLFSEVISMINESVDKVEDIVVLRQLSLKEDLNQTETDLLIKAMGYKNTKEYQLFQEQFRVKLNSLKDKFGKDALTQENIETSILELDLLNLRSDPCNCERIRNNCIASVTAGAVVAQLGCTSLDLTIIGGILCHAAVLVVQVSQLDTCNANAENCVNECNEN